MPTRSGALSEGNGNRLGSGKEGVHRLTLTEEAHRAQVRFDGRTGALWHSLWVGQHVIEEPRARRPPDKRDTAFFLPGRIDGKGLKDIQLGEIRKQLGVLQRLPMEELGLFDWICTEYLRNLFIAVRCRARVVTTIDCDETDPEPGRIR